MKSRLHLSLLLVLAVTWLGASRPGWGQTTNLVNDGSTVANLALLANQFGTGMPPASLHLTPVEGELEASQSPDYTDSPLNGVWFNPGVAPASQAYTVLVEARPVEPYPECVVGVMAWLDATSRRGVALRVVPGGFGSLQMATIDFGATTGLANDSTTELYQLDGTPAQPWLGSAWGGLGDYAAGSTATFSLEVTPPTAADLAVVTNATARLVGRIAQGEAGWVGDPIQLLTTLPVPEVHRFGYFASYGTVLIPGSTIGYLDQLRLVGELRIENQPPLVAITAPVTGSTFVEPAAVTVTVAASDPEGALDRIELYRGETLVATGAVSPATFTLEGLPVGMHTLTARAVDTGGGVGTSAPVAIEILPNQVPTVAITAPVTGSTFVEPATVTVTVEASDPEGALDRLELFRGDTLEGTAAVSPATFMLAGLPVGMHTLTARAVDAAGGRGTSVPVVIEILPNQVPTVAIISPADGSQFLAPANFTVTVEAEDPEDQLVRIELYRGGALVGSAETSPATFTVSGLAAGSYLFVAKATDLSGNAGESGPVNVQVTPPSQPPRLTDPRATPSPVNFEDFRFTATGLAGGEYRIEATSDLVTWTVERTGTITGATMEFSLPRSATAPHRVYRLVVGSGGPVEGPVELTGPTLLPSESDFQQFQFTAQGLTPGTYRIEATSNLTSWTVVDSGAVTGPTMAFTLPRNVTGPAWFYRLILVPGGGGEVTPARLAAPSRVPSAGDFQRFQFRAESVTGGQYRLEQSANLKHWTVVETGPVTGGTRQFDLPRAAGLEPVFYRLVSLP